MTLFGITVCDISLNLRWSRLNAWQAFTLPRSLHLNLWHFHIVCRDGRLKWLEV